MTHSANQKEKPCTIYLDQDEQNQISSQEIQKLLESSKPEDKIKALKALIIQMIHDDNFPRMIMSVINNVLPFQNETHQMKKVLLYYWEIVDKLNPNGNLKDEMILVCNSLRTDILHPNEYIRGRTLRLLSKLMYRGILEPLCPSIIENLTHKHSYVRRNAVSCLYIIYLTFQNDLIPDIDEHIEKMLQTENDLSTKRNAFLLLFNANQQKAMEYINKNIVNEQAEDMGDIMQLVVLELLRKTCKFDPTQKSKLMKAIFYFSNSKSSSVLFECANTLTQITTAPTAIKLAINIYIQLLCGNSDNNVKLIVLDKLHHIRQINSKLLEDQLIDITKVLSNQSFDIRKKTLDLIKSLLKSKNIELVFPIIKRELKQVSISNDPTQNDYKTLLLQNVQYCINNFAEIVEDSLDFLCENFFTQSKLDDSSSKIIVNIVSDYLQKYPKLQQVIVQYCLNKFNDIQSSQILKIILWSIGEYIQDKAQIHEAFEIIKKAIGHLPFEQEKKATQSAETPSEETKKQIRTKTVILQDGTYGTEIISEAESAKASASSVQSANSFLRENLLSSSFFASTVVSTLLKLVYKIRQDQEKYNMYSSQTLMILLGLLKFYNVSEAKTDAELINKLMLGIKYLTNPALFASKKISWLEKENIKLVQKKKQPLIINNTENAGTSSGQENFVAKQPDDLIVFRQLKGKTSFNDIDLSDEEVNEVSLTSTMNEAPAEEFTSKLKKIIQLTGYSDPIYAEAIVDIHKYDISFDILLINRTNKALQNVCVEFSTQGDLRVVDKPQQITLGPNQSASIKTAIKLVSSEAGLIFASINFENSAGIAQSYMITNEIQIDITDYIYPEESNIEEFRQLWSKYEWENKVIVNTHHENPVEFIKMIGKELKMYIISDLDQFEDSVFVSANLYAKTKLDDDFLMNISLEKQQNKLGGYMRLRSKTKGIIVSLGEKLKQIQMKKNT